MTKTEYWKMNDSVFIKTSEDGIFKDTKSISLDEVPKNILEKFEKIGGDYFFEDDGNLIAEAEKETNDEPILENNQESKSDNATEDSKVSDIVSDMKQLEDINMDIISVSKEEIEDFASKVTVEKPLDANQYAIDRTLPTNGVGEEKNIASYVSTLRAEHLGQEDSVKSETLISNGSFQDDIGSGSVDNYVANITGSSNSEEDSPNGDTLSFSKESKNYDFVQAPSHYNGHTIITKGEQEFEYETIEFIEAWLRRHSWMPEEAKYAAGNGLKYYDRVGNKPEDGKTREEKAAEDFEKISWYALRAAKALRGKLYKKD